MGAVGVPAAGIDCRDFGAAIFTAPPALQVLDRILPAARQRHDVIFDIAGTGAGCPTRRRAGVLARSDCRPA